MAARINHMAMNSPQWHMTAKFYEAVFGLRQSGKSNRPLNGVSVGDGYVGLNINPLRDGYVGGLDHFGMVVDSIEDARERMEKKFAGAAIVKRPSTRPFAQYSAHDPDGNVFDLAEPKSKLNEIYADQQAGGWSQERYLNKFAIRTMNAELCAEFYQEVFGLQLQNSGADKPGWHLTDGRVTLSILPWSIPIFENISIKRPGPDHIGFRVENLDTFKAHLEACAGAVSYLAPIRLGGSKEADARRDFLARSATGKMQICDPNAVWIDITDE